MSDPAKPASSARRPEAREYGVHGVRVSLSSNWSEFLDLGELMFGAFRPPGEGPESLSVRLDLRLRGWLESPAVHLDREGGEERLGTNEFLDRGAARYAAGRLAVRYSDGRDAAAQASYILDRTSRLRRMFAGRPPWGDLYALFRLAVHEPVLLKLEQRGAALLHASAAARQGQAVILIGLNGSGKSTLCASLLDELDYVSDNFVAVDGTRALGFPSALRMPQPAGGAPPGLAMAHGKSFVRPDPRRTRTAADARALVFLSLGAETSLAPLSPEEGLRHLRRVEDMTHEFPRHTYLGPFAPPSDPARLEALARSVPSYRLVMDRTAEARERVLSLV